MGADRPTGAIHNQLTYLLNVADTETVLASVSEINAMLNGERRLGDEILFCRPRKEVGEMRQRVSLVIRGLMGDSVSETVTKLVCIHLAHI